MIPVVGGCVLFQLTGMYSIIIIIIIKPIQNGRWRSWSWRRPNVSLQGLGPGVGLMLGHKVLVLA